MKSSAYDPSPSVEIIGLRAVPSTWPQSPTPHTNPPTNNQVPGSAMTINLRPPTLQSTKVVHKNTHTHTTRSEKWVFPLRSALRVAETMAILVLRSKCSFLDTRSPPIAVKRPLYPSLDGVTRPMIHAQIAASVNAQMKRKMTLIFCEHRHKGPCVLSISPK